MHRAVISLALSLIVAGGLLVWAIQPITDDLGRSCGGGIFSVTQPDGSDDSYLDVCTGTRQARQQDVQPLAIAAGLAVLGSLGWVLLLAIERRNELV